MNKKTSLGIIKMFSIIFICAFFLLLSINFFRTNKVFATNVLTNPSFTGGTTGWTLSNSSYDSSTYQDSAGSAYTTAPRKGSTSGITTQNSYTSISSDDTVTLSGYWSNTIAGNGNTTLYIEVAEESTPTNWTQLWTSGASHTTNSWTLINNLDVSSSFSTGSYRIRLRAEAVGGAAGGSQSDAWFDNLNLDVTPPNITVGTSGTQKTTLAQAESNAYLGGAFTFLRDAGTATVSSITVSELGTIADANISGLILYYKQEASCSTSIPGDATQFNSTAGTFSSGSSTVTGSMSIGTSQVCVYVEADIGSGASVDDTVEIEITSPSSEVTASSGTVSPATAVLISGTTTIVSAVSMAVDIVDAAYDPVTSPSVSMDSSTFDFENQTITGTLGTSSEQIYITTDSTTNWQVAIAATDGSTALWANAGSTIFYDFNDNTADAGDGGDADSYGGQLTINATTGTVSPGDGCSNTGLTLGSSSSFVEDTTNSITLLSASSADANCDWSVTGIGLSQTVPSEQVADSYDLDLTITIASV